MEVTLYVTDMVENRLTIINGYNLTLLLSLLIHRLVHSLVKNLFKERDQI